MAFAPSADPTKLTIGTNTPDYSKLAGGSYSLPSTNTTPQVIQNFQSSLKPPVSPVSTKPVGNPGNATAIQPTGTGGFTTNTPEAPTTFMVDTSNIPSDAITTQTSSSTVQNQVNDYLKYAQQLAQASGYSPEYLQAYNEAKGYQSQSYAIQGQYAANPGAFGETIPQAQTLLSREVQANQAAQGQANIALQTQELMRQGNILGAKALVEAYAPQSVSPGSSLVSPANGQQVYQGLGGLQAVNAINNTADLARQYPDAGILPTDDFTTAQGKVAGQSQKFKSEQLIYKAYGASLTQQQTYLDTVQRSFNTANNNLNAITGYMEQYGLNQSNVPIVNQLDNAVKAKLTDAGTVAAFKAAIAGLRAEYSQVLARGGARSVETDNAANQLIPDNISPAQLRKVAERLNVEGSNAIKEAQSQVAQIQQQLGGAVQSSASAGNPFSSAAFFGT